MDLVLVDCSDLAEGADVTLLEDIKEKPSIGLTCDVLEERAFFMEEEFATFNCLESFYQNCCEFRLISQIPWMDHYAWAIFNTHNLKMERGDVARKTHGKYAFISQNFAFELSEGENFGYFQLICIPEQVFHDSAVYHKFDLLTFMVYRNCKTARFMAIPHLVTLHPKAEHTYVPMVPGQSLQLIVSDSEDIEVAEDHFELVSGSQKLFTLGRDGKPDRLKAATYACRDQECSLFIENKSIIVPKMCVQDDGVYVSILKPVSDAVIYTEGVDRIQITCPGAEKWAWDEEAVDITGASDEIEIRLLKKINSLCLQYDNDIWWVFASKNMVGKI